MNFQMNDEICCETYHNLLLELYGIDADTIIYESNTYTLSLSDLLSHILSTLNNGTFIGIQIESIDEYGEYAGSIGHTFSILKIDNSRYNLIQTYVNYYSRRKYTSLSYADIIELCIQMHTLYTSPSVSSVREFYQRWFSVTLNDRDIAYPTYLKITTP
jgi:hypothetical protein